MFFVLNVVCRHIFFLVMLAYSDADVGPDFAGFYLSALRAGGVLSSRSGRAAGRAAAKLAEPISL